MNTKFFITVSIVFAIFSLLISCDGKSPAISEKPSEGSQGGRCYEDGSCDDGLICENGICIKDFDEYEDVDLPSGDKDHENGAVDKDSVKPDSDDVPDDSDTSYDDRDIYDDDNDFPDNDTTPHPDDETSDLCKNVDCNDNGICNPNTGKCSCYHGYTGEYCDECSPNYAGYPECLPIICDHGQRICQGNNIVECNEDRTGFFKIEACEGEGISCVAGQCMDVCDIAEYYNSYVGCEYWGAFLQQGGGHETNATYALVVSNPNETAVTVQIYGSGDTLLKEGSVAPNDLNYFEFDFDRIITGPGITDLAFKLVSSKPVTVTQMNPFGNINIYSNDATLLLPIGAIDKEYFVMSWPYVSRSGRPNHPGFISIVAVENGETEVEVTYSAPSKAGGGISAEPAGATVSYILDQYQILTINTEEAGCPANSNCYGYDLTGSFVSSDKKVAVFGGHQCTQIPADRCCCDHMEHQMFPLNTWGKEFVAARTKPRSTEVDYFRILASVDGTTVNLTGGLTETLLLNAGEVHDFSTNTDFFVSSDQPLMVAQFLASEQAGAGTGDPAMMLLAPNEQLRRDYIFLVPPNYDYNRITIIAEDETDVYLNGTPYSSNDFTEVPGTGWYRQWIDINEGVHYLSASKPVGLYVYGFSSYVSYAYIAGLDLERINY